MASLATARPPAYRIVEGFRPGVTQNGTLPEALLKFSIPHVTARSAARRPTAAATDASTSASTKS